MQLILASKSPRRKELLAQLGYQFECISADIDESIRLGESADQYVNRLSVEKAQCIAKCVPDTSYVLGSDTSVVFQKHILGKPENFEDCLHQLNMLSNNTHQVITAVAVVHKKKLASITVITEVTFKSLSAKEIKRYWETGEPQDKAGSYGIQGIGGQFVTQIHGSYSAVVGLPLYETAQLLVSFGLPTPIQAL